MAVIFENEKKKKEKRIVTFGRVRNKFSHASLMRLRSVSSLSISVECSSNASSPPLNVLISLSIIVKKVRVNKLFARRVASLAKV